MKKYAFLVLILAAVIFKSEAQASAAAKDSATQNNVTLICGNERTAEFPGGIDKLYAFIQKNARNKGCNGSVMIRFIVEKDGSLSNIHVIKNLSLECDAEALRVINMSPKWIPAIQNGKPVRVLYTIPVNFSDQ